MALSNIFREPRREIVETVVGIGVAFIPLFLDYKVAKWLELNLSKEDPIPWPVGMILLPCLFILILAVLFFVLLFIHELGDIICNEFQRRGIYLRPRNRY